LKKLGKPDRSDKKANESEQVSFECFFLSFPPHVLIVSWLFYIVESKISNPCKHKTSRTSETS
jgi:hypothetical protein